MLATFRSVPRTLLRAVRRVQGFAAAGVLLLVAGTLPALAADDASPWDGGARAAVRLVAGMPSAAGEPVLRAGIEIKLGAGWKTYWRYPGDSGVPPRFDFGGSENVERVDVLWPAPRSFSEGDGRTIGYADDVVLPLRVVLRDPAKPAVLSLGIEYAVCEKLCVPAEAKAELRLPATASSHEAALQSNEARVPMPVKLGEGHPLAITAVIREPGPMHPRVVVDVAAPEAASVDLFAEGPTPDWALPVPQPVSVLTPGLRRFAFDLDGLPPGARPEGAVIKLTAVAGDNAIEVDTRLD